MESCLVIGIIGKKQSGKDTFADLFREILAAQQGGPVHRVGVYHLADPIKQACRILFRLTEGQLHDNIRKETPDDRWGGRTPRQLFQWLGTDVFRNQFDPSFWLTHARYSIYERLDVEPCDVLLVPDVRFRNEAELIRSFPRHMLVRIVRGEDTPAVQPQHISESELETIPADWIHVRIENRGSKNDFKNDIETVVVRNLPV